MTLRGRLLAVMFIVGSVIVALSAISLITTVQAEALASAPQNHVEAGQRLHRFAACTSQAVKDLHDFVDGEEEHEQLEAERALARQKLRDVLADDPDDPVRLSLAKIFDQLDRGITRVIELAPTDREGAHRVADSMGEDLYEGPLRIQLAALDRQQEAVTIALAETTHAQTRWRIAATLAAVSLAGGGLLFALGFVAKLRRRLATLATAVRSFTADRQVRARDPHADELGQLATTFDRMADDLDQLIETRTQKEALAAELALAARLQRALLPHRPQVPGLEIVGSMTPASDVGGDYYDVIPTRDGAWIGIGDVSGHGFNSGIVMLMAQAAITGAIRTRPDAHPSEILKIVNEVLHDNVHARLQRHEHMTLTLLRYRHDGSLEFAGAHQEMIVRGADGRSRSIATSGPWVALLPELADVVDGRLQLAPGDTLVLFTDGVVEAVTRDDHVFGFDTLFESVAATPITSAEQVHDAVLARWTASTGVVEDDATVLVVRRQEAA